MFDPCVIYYIKPFLNTIIYFCFKCLMFNDIQKIKIIVHKKPHTFIPFIIMKNI